ncbi:MAG: hypothetical protein ACI8W9_000327 [Psychromonas sp.]|jgi:hypothetical protein
MAKTLLSANISLLNTPLIRINILIREDFLEKTLCTSKLNLLTKNSENYALAKKTSPTLLLSHLSSQHMRCFIDFNYFK